MSVPRRLAAFALVLAAAFGGGAAVGAVAGPIDVEADDSHDDRPEPADRDSGHGDQPGSGHDTTATTTGGHG